MFFFSAFDVIEVYIVLKFGLPPFSPPRQPHLCFCFYVAELCAKKGKMEVKKCKRRER